jgi:putative hydrolase of the HAD superfamily
MQQFEIIAFDADDTLWETERLYVNAQAGLRAMLSRYVADANMDERLYETEMHNLVHFGFGIKAFAISMIETAIEFTGGRISARDIQTIISAAREMMLAEIELIEHVPETIAALAKRHTLMLITKGDLRDQEMKIARSGLAEYFALVEIVSDKNSKTYRAILERQRVRPAGFLMAGNSLRSDILPVLELGAIAVYIPHPLTWAHEKAEPPPAARAGFHHLEHIGQLPDLVARLESRTSSES